LPAVSNSSTAGAAEQHSASPFATASSLRSRGRLSTQIWSSLSTNRPVMPPSAQWFGNGLGHSESYLYFGGRSAAAGAGIPAPGTASQHKPATAAEKFNTVLERIEYLPLRTAVPAAHWQHNGIETF